MEKELTFPQFVPLHIGYKEHHADWNFKKIHSPFFRIYLVTKGSATITINNEIHALTPGHLYMIPPFTTHTDSCNGEFFHYYIHVLETMENRKYSIFERFAFPFEIKATALDKMLVRRLTLINEKRKLTHSDPKIYDNHTTLIQMISQNELSDYSEFIETRGLLLQLFSRFLTTAALLAQTSNKRIMNVKKYIRENIESPIKTSTLANISCLNEDHFIRLFKKETGQTPLDYIQQKKIEKAQMMLIYNDVSIKDIAYSLSYTNISYFIRLFKNRTGFTPGEYAKNIRINSGSASRHI